MKKKTKSTNGYAIIMAVVIVVIKIVRFFRDES